MLRRFQLTGDDGKSWPVLVLLLIVVLLPTLGVLGFMDQAMRNERLAIRQRLSDVYLSRLAEIQRQLEGDWHRRVATLEARAQGALAAEFFARTVRHEITELPVVSVVIHSEPGYPAVARSMPSRKPLRGLWLDAQRLEHRQDFTEAAAIYSKMSTQGQDIDDRAQALQAKARVLARSGDEEGALKILVEELAASELEAAVDRQGRLIAPSALLRALELIDDGDDSLFEAAARLLHGQLSDYSRGMSSGQRLFLMKRLQNLLVENQANDVMERLGDPIFDTLEAESLATSYLASSSSPVTGDLQSSDLTGVWSFSAPSGALTLLFRDGELRAFLADMAAGPDISESPSTESRGTKLLVLGPGDDADHPFLVSMPIGASFPDWQLALKPTDQTLFATSAHQRIQAYFIVGSLVVLAILLLAFLIMRLISRQLRLTRLKNDLLGAVSHELKTPLSSIRLLVDTLLESGGEDPERDREYLQLIAQENHRLSRMVESFLSFSKLDQDDPPLDLQPTSAEEVAENAASALAERLAIDPATSDYELVLDIEQGMPLFEADPDALVTILINLLENAYKYSDADKTFRLSGFRDNGHLCLAVSDRGIGLSKKEASKIFDRFYQVDQSLSRQTGGCGLGLAIVERLVKAHGGKIDVSSEPGAGSTFTVRLPYSERGENDDGR